MRERRLSGTPISAIRVTAIASTDAARELDDERVRRIAGADAVLFGVNTAQDTLVVAHATERLRDAGVSIAVRLGSGVSGWVAANRSTIRSAEAALDLGELADELGVQTCVSVPVFVRADLFGVLTVYFTDRGATEEAIADVALLAQEVGLAIARGPAVLHARFPAAVGATIAAAS